MSYIPVKIGCSSVKLFSFTCKINGDIGHVMVTSKLIAFDFPSNEAILSEIFGLFQSGKLSE